jgi:hypothetical protein
MGPRAVLDAVVKRTKLTAWSTVLLEKLILTQLVKKFPAFYRKRSFIAALKRTRHRSLS